MKKIPTIKLTREGFLKAMDAGWKNMKYAQGYFFGAKGTDVSSFRDDEDYRNLMLQVLSGKIKVDCACAVGAAAFALKVDPDHLHGIIQDRFNLDVTFISDAAKSKRLAKGMIRKYAGQRWPDGKTLNVRKMA